MLTALRRLSENWKLPARAREEKRRDASGLPKEDPGNERVVDWMVAWLKRAQDNSASRDGGVARDFSLIRGWATSYPETTGYIVPTMLEYADLRADDDSRRRARLMLDWLVRIQLPCGGFQGGRIDSEPVVPVAFNTGQILIGLAAGQRCFGAYETPMIRAADWLAKTQDADGSWRRHPTPFAAPGEKAYETHVAWGLFEADRVARGRGYGEAGLQQVRWALTHQRDNGWFDKCCLTNIDKPLTHTIGYALRGVIEAYRWSNDPRFLDAARLTADGLRTCLSDEGFLPGRLEANWHPAVDWACLTGIAQIAHCWLILYSVTNDDSYREAARSGNAYVRRTVRLDAPPEARGGVKGSFPVDGDYGRFEYLNWAAKFAVDSNIAEMSLAASP